MQFAVNIYTSPTESTIAASALGFCQQLLQQGHGIERLFFFSDGVWNCIVDEQSSLPTQWQTLIERHQLDAVVCVASAEKRAIVAKPGEGQQAPLEGFHISGLGQLIDAGCQADRVMTFAG